jgi:cytochrome b pre-mRNA-processing protein 3
MIHIQLPENKAPIIPKHKRPLLSDSKYEKDDYKISSVAQSVGEFVISTLRLDMDRIRAGPIAGSHYYAECKKQGLQFENEELSETAEFFYEGLKLPRTFSQWFQITALHTWILSVRMRALPFKYGKNYQQKLIDRFFRDMELRLHDEMNVNSSRISDQYLKDYNSQLRGLVRSYDEGFASDDATLATALWRNLFNARPEIDYVHLEAAVKYVRIQLYILSKVSDRDFGLGKFQFASPNDIVERFTPEQEAEILARSKEAYEGTANQSVSARSNLSYTN